MRSSSPMAKAALIMSMLALVVAVSGGAYAAIKLKKNAVKTKNIKDGAVTGPKIAKGVLPDAPAAYVRFDGAGNFVPGDSKGVVSFTKPVPNVACLDLAFVPKTGIGSRGISAGGPPINSAQVAVGSAAAVLCTGANPSDAIVQVAAATGVNDLTAWFED
jgi:hypothetical protein